MFCMRTDNIMSVKLIEEVTFFFFLHLSVNPVCTKPLLLWIYLVVYVHVSFFPEESWQVSKATVLDNDHQWPLEINNNTQVKMAQAFSDWHEYSGIVSANLLAWCKPPGGWQHSGDFQCGSGSSVQSSEPSVHWLWLPLVDKDGKTSNHILISLWEIGKILVCCNL